MEVKDRRITYSLLISQLFPLFPVFFGKNSQHIILLNVFITFVLFRLYGIRRNCHLNSFILFYFLFQFLLLTFDTFLGAHFSPSESKFTDFLTLSKPFYLFSFLSVGYYLNSSSINILKQVFNFFKIITVIGAFYFILEIVLYEQFKPLIHLLYKREEREILIDRATTWFGVTYYSGFFWLIISTYNFLNFLKTQKVIDMILLIVSIILLLASQSRTIIIALIFMMFFYLIDSKIRFRKKNIVIRNKIFAIFILSLVLFSTFIKYYEQIRDNFKYVISLFELAIDNKLYLSGSLNLRLEQIQFAFQENKFFLIGWSLGRDVPLESIYAAYQYRYGFIFLISSFLLGFIIFKKSRFLIKHATLTSEERLFLNLSSLILMVSPIAFFSSPILETPKLGFIYFLLIGLTLRTNEKIKYHNSTL